MASALALEELLSPGWLKVLGPVITAQDPKDLTKFLSKSRSSATIPSRENTFAALKGRDASDCNVVILGQDPYPRAESAVGVAFNDGAIKKVLSPTNLVKPYCIG